MSAAAASANDGPQDAALRPASASPNKRFMQLALALGRRGLGRTWPNPAVGAVVVKDGVILGRGWTQPGGRPHAETEALKRAGKEAKGATLYVTLEPCSHQGKTPPCTDAIVRAGILRVVSALEDLNPQVAGQGYAKLRERGIAVDAGLGAEEAHARARRPYQTHARRPSADHAQACRFCRRQGRPARTQARRDHRRGGTRTRPSDARGSDAILVGIGTVLSDDPHLTCRLPGMLELSPVRVVLDAKLRIPLAISIIAHGARHADLGVRAARRRRRSRKTSCKAEGVEVFRVGRKDGRLDLTQVLKALAARGITRLMVEGGPTVAAAFIEADLVDEAALFRSPNELGPGIDALEGLPLTALTKSPKLESAAPNARRRYSRMFERV